MKKILYLFAVMTLILSGCQKLNDKIDRVDNKVNHLEGRVDALEELCKQMNTNISSLQTLVKALQQNDYVTGVTPITKNGEVVGYTISFTKSEPITIYHGNNGEDGTNGSDGVDGHTPQIGVKEDSDGIYYWTVDGEWLLDDSGNKVKAVGIDGKDGENGTDGKDGQDGSDGKDGIDGNDGQNGTNGVDGITPQLKIENDYWYISYDNGDTWNQLGKASGEDGMDGEDGVDGDSMFSDIDCTNDDFVIFTLSDGTQIKLPTWYAFEQLQTLCNQMNTNIASLQTIVGALQNNDYVQSITPLMENGKEVGYTITFTKSGAVTIYHGKDGKDGANGNDGQNGTNGTNGVDGKDGKDGHTPQIGVKQDTDGIYYWTVDGEWLLDDNGNKIKAVGTDGKDGQDGANGNNGQNGADGTDGTNGADGITPELKIEGGYWYVSYDEGATWKQLGKATGEDGQNGADGTDGTNGKDGDSFFQSVDNSNSDYVVITLADGTEIKLPTWYAFEQLQKLCNQMNTNIASLQTIVGALQNNDYVQSITPLMENGKEVGYTITFTKSGAVTIYHGKDGANGNDGQNGTNGVDGHTPTIGVKQDTDGVYYWTVDGEWLLDDNGNKIKAVGKDGQDGANGNDGQNGTNGTDGITPELKIENGYWYVSYDEGATWKQLGKATGEDGQNGADGTDGTNGKDGDSFFQGVDTSNSDYVILTLADGTEIKLPTWYAFEQLQKFCNQMNTNIASLQTIVGALQNNDYVQGITPLMENGKEVGYTITFTKSGVVTIYHGKDGANGNDGQNGTNGTNGVDGHTPQIGVKQYTDGIYYWTVDGEWLLDDNGNKIKAVGTDGKDGQDGANGNDGQNGTNGIDGITPELKIEGGYWYVSYDEGATWKQLGKATGEDGQDGINGTDGKDGQDGDSFFQSVTEDEYNVYITLADGSVFTLPKTSSYLFNRLQSITFIPKYSDGKVCVKDGIAELDFQVSPKDAVKEIAKNWESILKAKSIYTITRAVSFIDMPILSCEADEANGVISITISDDNLSEEFFIGTQSAEIALALSDGNNEITSEYIPISPYHPYNEIWYTTSDGSSVTSIESWGDARIMSNSYVNGKGVIRFDRALTIIPSGKFPSTVTSVTIPEKVTTIGEEAFKGRTSLGSITLPKAITTIEDGAFSGCTALTQITIPSNVAKIGVGAFSGCAAMDSIIMEPNTNQIEVGDDAFEGKTLTKVYITDLKSWCEHSSIAKELDVTYFTLYLNGEPIENLVIPNDVTVIKEYAFYCTNIKSVEIGDNVTTIGERAFDDSPSAYPSPITKITIGGGVTTIGYAAFRPCPAKVYIKAAVPPACIVNNKYIRTFENATKLYVPTESLEAYKVADEWKEYKSIMVGYNFQ